jgi:exodeoxyribonuclease-5
MIELNSKQLEGLELAVARYKAGEKCTIISGYAGTGKSTLVKFIIAALEKEGIDPDKDVVYTSFTGKATQVLQKKGNKNVSTLHKLLFEFFPRADGTFYRRPVGLIPYKIVIVDECSMVPKDLLKRLASYNVHIICLGDPGQLPPIDKKDDNHLLDIPHVFLDEIMRQEEQSEIIKLTMDIRAGKPLNHFQGNEVQILDKEELTTGMLLWADQIICSTNATRVALNNQMRDLLGRGDAPEDGDKVICLRNYWETISEDEQPLVNGTIGYLKNSFTNFLKIPAYVTGGRLSQIDTVMGDFCSDDGVTEFKNLTMDKKMILEGEPTLNWKEAWKLSNNKKYMNSLPLSFTYGYAITAHKSQGSEWDNVLVIEEGFPFDKEEHKRWLYTACTRAAKKLVIIRKG